MSSQDCTVIKVIEHGYASPPPGSVPNTSIPLTFFDIPWLLCCPVQRLFFYEFPYSTLHFKQNVLPSLKSSLSQALQVFYPFAAKLICPPSPRKPHILYTEDDRFVPFTVAESFVDFERITTKFDPRDVKEIHPFVPQMSEARVLNGARVMPMLAVQVTVFPNSGICVGVTINHVAADGRSFNHFLKAWASVLRSGSRNSAAFPTPFFDRSLIMEKDTRGIESTLLNQWWSCGSDRDDDKVPDHDVLENKVRATFFLCRGETEKLKRYVLDQSKDDQQHLRASTFVVSCAFLWSCWTKARELRSIKTQDNDAYRYFCLIGDCRNRPELGIPETYFGNCLALCFARMEKSELLGENGVVAATKAIGNSVREFENGVLREAEKWVINWKEISGTGQLVTIAGSPKLRAYETDFGWGKPKKTEVVHIDVSQAIYVGDCRDEEGGIEISLALSREEMEAFKEFLEHGLKMI